MILSAALLSFTLGLLVGRAARFQGYVTALYLVGFGAAAWRFVVTVLEA